MKVRFLGPLGVVTGSCTWMRDVNRGWSFLIDCGLQQGERTQAAWNQGNWPFDPATLKFVVLTHAHTDHCGLLPALYQRGFTGPVYCTKETAGLARALLLDCTRHSDVYTEADVARVQWKEPGERKPLGDVLPVDDDLFLRFFRSGHIVGAVSVAVLWGAPGPAQRSMIFSGDLGPDAQGTEMLPLLRFRMEVPSHDYAVVESTYGGTVRRPEERDSGHRLTQLQGLLDQTLEKRGLLLLPAFSLARTQDVLFDLHTLVAGSGGRYDGITFHLDSPLACRMHETMLEGLSRTERTSKGKVRLRWLGKQVFRKLGLDDSQTGDIDRALAIVRTTLTGHVGDKFKRGGPGNALAQSWRPILTRTGKRKDFHASAPEGPCVIVTSSGTCDGGPVSHWLPRVLRDGANTVALTGFAPPASVGGQLLALQNIALAERARDMQQLRLTPDTAMRVADIHATIARISGYSAHADQRDLLDWLSPCDEMRQGVAGRTVFIQHGEDREREALARALGERLQRDGREAVVHRPNDPQAWWSLEEASQAETQAARQAIESQIADLQRRLNGLA